MKWLSRVCWTAAWMTWIWLGVQLDRELPRGPGEIVCRLPFQEGEEALGFIEEIPGLVTQINRGKDGRPVVRYWYAYDAHLMRDVVCPIAGASLVNSGTGWVIAFPPEANTNVRSPPLAFDLLRERWLELPRDAGRHSNFHWFESWGLFFDWNKQGRPENIQVVDLMSGKPLFRWKPRKDAPESVPSGQPFFIGDDAIAVPTSRKPASGGDGEKIQHYLEVWHVLGGNRPTNVFQGVIVGDDPLATKTGRVAWHELGKSPPTVRVFDVPLGRTIFSRPPADVRQEPSPNGEWPAPQLSTDGSAVLGIMSARLWDLSTGRELWAPRPGESISKGDSPNDVFETKELWNVGDGVLTGQSYAVQSLQTGELLFRCMEPTLLGRGLIHGPCHLRFDPYLNAVRRFPPAVNWPLFLLCQSILALPLILLWLALRWRRTRRLRLSSAAL